MKEYKVLSMSESEMKLTNQHIAIFELSEIKYYDLDLSNFEVVSYTSGDSEIKIVLDFNSHLTKRIIEFAKKNEPIKLNLSEIEFRNVFNNGIIEEIGYHSSVNLIEFDDDKIITSKKLENIVEECILYHHTDMFFNSIYRYIINKETYEHNNISNISDLSLMFETYKKVCKYVLIESAKIVITDCEDITEDEDTLFSILYNLLVSHAKNYCDVINTYANSLEKEKIEIIKWELNDKPPIFAKFQQLCLIKGFKIALKRIENNLNNNDFFSHEIIKTTNFEVLKFFPTPFGFGRKWELVEYVKDSSLLYRIEEYFIKHNFELIKDDDMIKSLGTRLIFKSLIEDKVYYFKRRLKDENYIEFAEQNRKKPFMALLVQGQLNLTKK